MTFSIQLPPAPLRSPARKRGSTASESGEMVAPMEWPISAMVPMSKLARLPGATAPGHPETSILTCSSRCACKASSAADWRTLSRSATGLPTLKMRKSSFPLVRLRNPPSGPSMLDPAKPTLAKSSAGPVPGTSAGPPLTFAVPRSTSGRLPPAPVRLNTTIGYPAGGIGERGMVTTKLASSIRCSTGLPAASNTQPPPVLL
jgi:hypothetical protein